MTTNKQSTTEDELFEKYKRFCRTDEAARNLVALIASERSKAALEARISEHELLKDRLSKRTTRRVEYPNTPSLAWNYGHVEAIHMMRNWSKERIAQLNKEKGEDDE